VDQRGNSGLGVLESGLGVQPSAQSVMDESVVTQWSLSGHSVVTQWSLSGHSVVTQWSLSGHSLATQRSRSGGNSSPCAWWGSEHVGS
jgi:hypothetical protein